MTDAADGSALRQGAGDEAHEARVVDPLERRRGLWLAFVTVALCVLALVAVLHLRRADLRVPFSYRGDANFYLAMVKGSLDHGWTLHNPDLGAPFGSDLADFPQTDNLLQLLMVKFLGLFTRDAAAVVNLFYLLTFPLVGLAALYVLRRLGVSPVPAVAASVLFAFAPYHFFRGANHLFFSFYVAVPLGAYLALLAFYGGRPPPRITSLSTLGSLGVAAVVGSTGAYYAAFTIVLTVTAAAFGFVSHRQRRGLMMSLAVVGVIAGALLLNLSPSIVHRVRHGTNRDVAVRSSHETELYALKITSLVLPIPEHRFRPAASLRAFYDEFPVPSEQHALGAVGTVGFVWLGVVALMTLAGASRPVGMDRYRPVALLATVAVVFATVGGASSVVAMLITSQFRAWNRMSIFITFLALVAVAWLLDDLWRTRRPGGRRLSSAAVGASVVAVLVFGLWDQTSPAMAPDYAGTAAAYRSDRAYVQAIEDLLPGGAVVHQLPYQPFPEGGPVHHLPDYDHARLYLHSRSLRWTYGAMQGRAEDWSAELADEPISATVPALVSGGVAGISIDRAGYPDGGAALEADVHRLTGAQPLESADGRLAFFDLSAYRARLTSAVPPDVWAAARAATLRPVRPVFGKGFSGVVGVQPEPSRTGGDEADAALVNPGPGLRRVHLQFELHAERPGAISITVASPDGTETVGVPANGSATFSRDLTLRAGSNPLRFTAGPPNGAHRAGSQPVFRIARFSISDFALVSLEAAATGASP